MSFLARSRNSQKWGRTGSNPASASFSVRTGRRVSGETDSVLLRAGTQEPVRDSLAAEHFLRNETQAARKAVEALDTYILKLASFQDKALEVIEEAHRALSRLERAVALSAAPELIVVACEIKVACHRGLHLFRTYGKYRYLGKVVALATRSSITAKFDAVIGRLTAIMPLDRTPSFTSIRTEAAAAAAAVAAAPRLSLDTAASMQQVTAQNSTRASLDDTTCPETSLLLSQQQQPQKQQRQQQPQKQQQQPQQPQQQQVVVSGTAGSIGAAGAGAQDGWHKTGSARSSGEAQVPPSSVTQTRGAAPDGGAGDSAAAVLSVVLHSSEAAKVTCISFVELPGAPPCIWWAAGDRLEFYSTSTQSTTSFAPYTERAAVTAVAVDRAGNVWCANNKGAVLMRQQRNWEQVFVEHAFSSCVRCLATDADSDVVWAGDESGRLAVFRFAEEGSSCRLECTATILPGRAGAGARSNSSSALLDVKPKTLSRWHALSCRRLMKDQQGVAEGPIRTMLVRDDRAWVGGGRTDPWIGLFDAVLGTQLDMWSCGHFGSCLAMTSLVTSDALTEMAAATNTSAAAAGRPLSQRSRPGQGEHALNPGLDVPPIVPEDNIGEDPRSGWRLVTGHESGQLLLWNAAADRLAPVIKIGDPGLSPVKALCVMEQQGLLAVVHANGDLAMFLRPNRDRDWHMGPATPQPASAAASDGGGGPAAATASAGPSSEQLLSVALPGAPGERGRSGGGGGAAGAALTTVKPRRVVLRSHRSMLVAAAACSNGVVTANAVGTIKLWPAEGLAKEAERFGLCPTPLHAQATRESSASSLGRAQQPVTRQGSDSFVSNAHSPFLTGSGATDPAAAGGAGAAEPLGSLGPASTAAAAAAALAGPAGFGQQARGAGLLQQQLGGQQDQAAAMLAWQQQQLDGIAQQQHLYGMSPHREGGHRQQLTEPNLARLSEPGVQWLQQQQQQQQQQMFMSTPGAAAVGSLPEQLANPLVTQQQQQQQQLLPLERRSAPLEIPWHASMSGQPAAAGSSGRGGGMGTAMYVRLTAQHQLGQLGGSPGFSGASLPDALGASAGGPEGAPQLLAGSLPADGFHLALGGSQDGSLDPGCQMLYAAPRAPKALRERGMNRERRRSERRLSKGANIAWATCQIINASELRMLECIGGGAYGQVFLAEWMGTQVAAKQLLSFQNKAKDAVTKRKANERAAQRGNSCRDDDGDSGSDSDSDTDSVDSVEEEVAAELKQLMDEVWVLGSLSHPSITRFCALCLDPPMIVMQYYPHGSLFDLLKRGRRGEKRALHELTWQKRLDMLRDIASGMVFLHSRKPPIVHGDLRSPNLLLDLTIERDRPRFHVKIADFGLARMVGPTSSIAVSKVTNPRWSAPEVLRNSVVSLHSDVFSFAVVMWELLTWQQPYEDMMSVQVLFSVMQNFRPEIPPEDQLPGKPGVTLPRYLSLMERCWAEDEHARPTFEELLLELDDLRAVEAGQARLRGGEGQRSVHGSTRVSYSEAPNTPTGSSRAPSAPGSNVSSAPNSGRDGGANALAVAAAAGAAAETSAALRRQRSAEVCGRGAGASDPGTPTGGGMFGNGAGPGAPGRVQVPGGSVPTSASSTSSGGGGGGFSTTQPGSCSSPGPMAGPSELSFAMARPAPLLAVQPQALGGPASTGPGQTSPAGAVVRTPSRLGPSRCSSTMASPTAMTAGMAVLQEVQPGLEYYGGGTTAAADSPTGAGRATYSQRRNSGGANTGFGSSAGQQSPTQAAGSRLRRLSWGTLEGSLQSSGSGGSKQLGLPLSRASWGGSVVHEYPPAAAAASQPAGERPYSPFSAMQQAPGTSDGAFAAQDAAVAVVATGAECTSGSSRPYASRSASTSGGVVVPAPAAAATAVAPARPSSPFAAVQDEPPEDASAAEAAAAASPAAAPAPARPCSPFAAAQRQSTGDTGTPVSAGASTELMTSRQGTDDSVAAAQPPARPSSPFAAVQAAAEPLTARGAGVTPVAVAPADPGADRWLSPRPHSPFAAVQERAEAGPSFAPAAAGQQRGPAAAAGAAARPRSPFAAAQQLQECSSDAFRVESLTGSPFASLSLQHSSVSSSGSCPGPGAAAAAAAAGAHAPSRVGATGHAHVSPQAAVLQQQQQQPAAGEQPWRPPSPFAGVQVAAVQGPIVAQQAKTVLSQLSPTRPAQEQGGPMHMQHAAAVAGSPRGAAAAAAAAAAAGGNTAFTPLASFVVQDPGQRPRLQAQAAAAAAAHDNGAFPGASGDSITFPSGLGAVESVVFLRHPAKRNQPPPQ